jgi:hypothetical protein
MTFVRVGDGPALGYHVSWHKPAAPLLDALQVLHQDQARSAWLKATLDLHIWDRGGCGLPTLEWARSQQIPYLTVSNGSVQWTEYEHPRLHTASGVPVFVRPDARLCGWDCLGGAPLSYEIVFPAQPDKGLVATRALRYRSAVLLPQKDLAALDVLYKTRWPSNENAIKALTAVGFGTNLDRTLVPTTSRGTDGALARLQARIVLLEQELKSLQNEPGRSAENKRKTRARKLTKLQNEQAAKRAEPENRGARAPTGAELLCKNLMLWMFNALALLLADSAIEAIRKMTPGRVRSLLLGRSMLACFETHHVTLWIDPVHDPAERRLQEELMRLFEARRLMLHGLPIRLRLQPRLGKTQRRRVSV